jgi:hypothetical protein
LLDPKSKRRTPVGVAWASAWTALTNPAVLGADEERTAVVHGRDAATAHE